MARAMGVDRGDSAPQLGRSGSKKKVLDKRQHSGHFLFFGKQAQCHVNCRAGRAC